VFDLDDQHLGSRIAGSLEVQPAGGLKHRLVGSAPFERRVLVASRDDKRAETVHELRSIDRRAEVLDVVQGHQMRSENGVLETGRGNLAGRVGGCTRGVCDGHGSKQPRWVCWSVSSIRKISVGSARRWMFAFKLAMSWELIDGSASTSRTAA